MPEDELRRVRIAAFEKRLQNDDSLPATLRKRGRTTAGGGEFAEHHVFADDLDALRELCLDPRSCTKVDGYWRVNGDVYFVELEADPSRPPLRATLSLAASRHPESSLRVVRVVFSAVVVESWWLQIVLGRALPWLDGRDGRFEV